MPMAIIPDESTYAIDAIINGKIPNTASKKQSGVDIYSSGIPSDQAMDRVKILASDTIVFFIHFYL